MYDRYSTRYRFFISDIIDVTITHVLCIEKKTLCTTSSISEKGDMDTENHSVVVNIGSHSVKPTVSRLITLMGIL